MKPASLVNDGGLQVAVTSSRILSLDAVIAMDSPLPLSSQRKTKTALSVVQEGSDGQHFGHKHTGKVAPSSPLFADVQPMDRLDAEGLLSEPREETRDASPTAGDDLANSSVVTRFVVTVSHTAVACKLPYEPCPSCKLFPVTVNFGSGGHSDTVALHRLGGAIVISSTM